VKQDKKRIKKGPKRGYWRECKDLWTKNLRYGIPRRKMVKNS